MRRGWLILTGMLLVVPAQASEPDGPCEHFVTGEMRGSLSWDSVTAIETGVLKFGGAYGVHVANGIEIGYEQQFILPPGSDVESRSWGYIRTVPFRTWPVHPFLSARVGYYILPDQDAVAIGAGGGAVLFVDSRLAFEASLFTQAVFSPVRATERQTEFDWRLVLYF